MKSFYKKRSSWVLIILCTLLEIFLFKDVYTGDILSMLIDLRFWYLSTVTSLIVHFYEKI